MVLLKATNGCRSVLVFSRYIWREIESISFSDLFLILSLQRNQMADKSTWPFEMGAG
jgi:hypothetical protein|tara:strand:- start:95296 stop:95466 length:171 start_codon:yes stop_codon:yes gene_type:complete